jgi:outer membrane lipoprotein-sorting protein
MTKKLIRVLSSTFALAAFSSLLSAPSYGADSLSAKEVMTRNEDARKISDVTSNATLTTGGGGSAEKTKGFTWWRKLTGDSIRYNTLTRFLQPAEVRGEAILFLERESDQNDVQMYLPAFKKVRRVESQQQSGSFMGSEFSYADIATPHVDDYKQSFKPEADCGTPAAKCYVVESEPVNDAVKERTGYSKTVQWIRKDNFMAVSGEFYGLDGALRKKMAATEIKEVDPSKHKWMALNVRIENAQSGKVGKFTTLKFENVKVNTGLQDSLFTVPNLSREH